VITAVRYLMTYYGIFHISTDLWGATALVHHARCTFFHCWSTFSAAGTFSYFL